MSSDNHGFDPSIVLAPSGYSATQPKRGGQTWIYLIVICGFLLSFATIFAVVAKVVSLVRASNVVVTVAAFRDDAEMRAEAIEVFGNFDAVAEQQRERPPEEQQERDEIMEFVTALQAASTVEDSDDFHELVDFERLMKRLELTGALRNYGALEKFSVKPEIKSSLESEDYWGKLVVAGIVKPFDDPDSRIIYAYGWDTSSDDQTEFRIWIARTDDGWKLYDWERLDRGLSEVEEWALYVKHWPLPSNDQIVKWEEICGEADRSFVENDYEAAKQKLRRAEIQSVPHDFEDFRWFNIGYRWSMLNEDAEADRCFSNVSDPDKMPGIHYHRMQAHLWTNPIEALKHAKLYEDATGVSPNLLEEKADLLERCGRYGEAANTWKALLRIQPEHPQALTKLFQSLPEDDKSDFEAQLDRLEDPVAATVAAADAVAYSDYDGLLWMAAYLERKAPDSAGAAYVQGLEKQIDGQYAEAAKFLRQAFEKEADPEKKNQYVNTYLDVMAAEGRIVEALKSAPDPKTAFDAIIYKIDEGEFELPKDEYQEVVAAFRELVPDALNGMFYQAQADIEAERYAEAETRLRAAMELAPADSEESDWRNTFAASLAQVLYKLNRLSEAYELGSERNERFNQLASMAIHEKKWGDVQMLLNLHRANAPDDPQIHRIEGELAAAEKRWDEAIRHFQRADAATPENEKWRLGQRLPQICIESGKWEGFYQSHAEPIKAYEMLASQFKTEADWDNLKALTATHRLHAADDPQIVKYEAEAAWGREDFGAYIDRALRALETEGCFPPGGYEREQVEDRLLSAYLRTRQFDSARQRAEQTFKKKNDAGDLALVNAATDRLGEAKQAVRNEVASNGYAGKFYWHDEVGPLFLSERFTDLHREVPVELPYTLTSTVAVFSMDAEWQLDADRVAAVVAQLAGETRPTIETLPPSRAGASPAIAVRFSDVSIWLASGKGKFNDEWKLDKEESPLAVAMNNSPRWFAIGVAGWTDPCRERAGKLARQLAVKLVQDHATVFCTTGRQTWHGYRAYPAEAEILAAWEKSKSLAPFRDNSAQIEPVYPETDIKANRKFERSLRDAMRDFEANKTPLEVMVNLPEHPSVEPLWLEVTAVERDYFDLQFDGTLQDRSILIPELRKGLPMRWDMSEIHAWRKPGGEAVHR